MEEQYYSIDAFRFLYETRLRKMGLNAPHIADDLQAKLASGDASFNLEPVEKTYQDNSVLTLTITNIDRDKNDEAKNRYYLNGPIEVQYQSPDGIVTKALIPLDNQQGPHLDSIKNIMDGNTPYLTINTRNAGARDKMFILTNEKDENGFTIVRTYGANIEQLNAEFKKLPTVGITARQKDYLFDSIKNGNIHKTVLRNLDGNREELFIQASRSNDMLIRDKDGKTVTLIKSGLERVNKKEQDLAPVKNMTEKLVEKAGEKPEPEGTKLGKRK